MQGNSDRNRSLRRLQRAALGSMVAWLALAPSEALATCVITSGTGTVANPGPNSQVVCTGTTTGINVATTNTQVTIQVDGGSTINGDPTSSAINLGGDFSNINVGDGGTPGPAAIIDTDLRFTGFGSGFSVIGGSTINLSGNPLFEISMSGGGSAISIADGHVTVPRPISIAGGTGSTFYIGPDATLVASSNFTGGAMIVGGAGVEVFYIQGAIETLGANAVETIVDAGDGDDIIFMDAGARFRTGIHSTAATTAFLLNGGDGYDQLQLENIDQSLTFDSTGIELLSVNGGPAGISRISGSHDFQEIRTVNGQLDIFGEDALGVSGSLINILGASRVRFFGTGAQVLTQSIDGQGTFEYASGVNEFASANFINGNFIVSNGTPLISHSNAFGTAIVTNGSSVILRDVSIANNLRGSGDYIIDGTSTSLSGANSMTGLILVQSGRLLVTDVANLGSGQTSTPATIVIGSQGSLNLDLQSSSTLENALSGFGTINKTSIGELTIDRSNSAFSGQVNLLGGRVFLSASDALGTGSINFGGSIIDFTNTSDIVISNTFTSGPGTAAAFEKNGTGRTTLTGSNLGMTASFALNQGILAVNSVNAFGTGSYANLGGTSGIEVNNAADETLGLRIFNGLSSIGTFRKLGLGRLTIVDTFQVGMLLVDAGTLRVNQTINAANATIAGGARLDGTGTIIGNLTNNGTLAPGNSIGTLTVNGNYVQNAGSVLEIEFDASGNIDLLAVTGSTTLTGGILRFVSLGGAEGSGGTFLTASGGVTGTFASVETVGAQLPLAVLYQTNSAIMAPSVLTARPSTFNAQFLAAADSGFGFMDRISSAANGPQTGKRLWLQGFGADGSRSASGTTLAYGHDGYGLAGGLILPVGDKLSIGASVGWSRSNIALGSGGGSGEQDAVLGSLHLRYGGDGFTLEGGGLYGSVDQQTLRNVSFNGFAASVDGSTQSKLYGGFVGAEADVAAIGKWDLSLSARASLIHQDQDGFTESGTSPLRLAVPDIARDTLAAQAGVGISRKVGEGQISFDLGARLVDNLGDRAIPVIFAANAAGITLQGDTRSAVHGFAAAALDLPLSETVAVHVGYAGQIGQSDRHEGRVGLSAAF